MILAKCIKVCWDSELTKQYFIGDIAELPEDHVFLKMKEPCFIPITAEDLAKSRDDANVKINQMATLIASQSKRLSELEKPMRTDELVPEEKRPVGRPAKPKE